MSLDGVRKLYKRVNQPVPGALLLRDFLHSLYAGWAGLEGRILHGMRFECNGSTEGFIWLSW